MREAALLPEDVDEPEALTRAIANAAALYVAAATQQLRGLVELRGQQSALSGWTVTRALVELCGRVGWLLDPDAASGARVARFYMEQIVSAHKARLASRSIGDKAGAKRMKDRREKALDRARTMFPDVQLYEKEDELNGWQVGTERYASLGGAVNDFAKEHLNTSGLYDSLSTFTHPSLFRLAEQTQPAQLSDRVQHTFVAPPEVVRWQLATASGCVYRAAHHVAGYLELETTLLEVWADENPTLLSWTRDDAQP